MGLTENIQIKKYKIQLDILRLKYTFVESESRLNYRFIGKLIHRNQNCNILIYSKVFYVKSVEGLAITPALLEIIQGIQTYFKDLQHETN